MPKHRPYRKHDYDAIFNFIIEYKRTRAGNTPALTRIMEACNITSSKSVVRNIINTLERDGKLTIISGKGEPLQIDIPGYSYRPEWDDIEIDDRLPRLPKGEAKMKVTLKNADSTGLDSFEIPKFEMYPK